MIFEISVKRRFKPEAGNEDRLAGFGSPEK
jgi:hypothetical protein